MYTILKKIEIQSINIQNKKLKKKEALLMGSTDSPLDLGWETMSHRLLDKAEILYANSKNYLKNNECETSKWSPHMMDTHLYRFGRSP